MGYKSTIDITRHEAIQLIIETCAKINNEALSEVLSTMGFGDNEALPYCGNNFKVLD